MSRLGVGVDALNYVGAVFTAAVFDADVFDGMVDQDDEGDFVISRGLSRRDPTLRAPSRRYA